MFIKSKENKSLVSTYPEEGYSRNIKLDHALDTQSSTSSGCQTYFWILLYAIMKKLNSLYSFKSKAMCTKCKVV
jgi:hypothetical protein